MYHKTKRSQSLITYNENGYAENLQDVQQIVKIEKRHFKKGEFFMINFNLLELLTNYNKTEIKTLIALQRRLDFNNRIKTFRQVEVANEIGTNQANVSRAIQKLESDKIIRKDGLEFYFSDEFIKGAGDNKESKKYK